jgi:hypothetical protein
MINNFRRLTQETEKISKEKQQLLWKVAELDRRLISIDKNVLVFPVFPQNMGEMGVTSPMKSAAPTDDGLNSSASPVQTVTGKDSSNPLMAVALPKSQTHGGRI